MMDEKDTLKITSADSADDLLKQLLHLKNYERPDAARMVRSKQNIMRRVREVNSRKRHSLSSLLEVNIPWFFAEPRYGIATLFVIFATLQFWGVSAHKQGHAKPGIYTGEGGLAMTEQNAGAYTNTLTYPDVPGNLTLFQDQVKDGGIIFVNRKIDSEK